MRAIDYLGRATGYLAMAFIVVLMLLTVSDVFMRYVFTNPITGTQELTEMILAMLLISVAWCALERRHVMVDIVMKRFSPKVQGIVEVITLLASLAIFAVLAWRGLEHSFYVHSFNVSTEYLDLPVHPFYWVMVAGFAMLCLTIINLIIRKIMELKNT
ncbi:TRAP transporter small permease subunit [Chloroflexota bacterium]